MLTHWDHQVFPNASVSAAHHATERACPSRRLNSQTAPTVIAPHTPVMRFAANAGSSGNARAPSPVSSVNSGYPGGCGTPKVGTATGRFGELPVEMVRHAVSAYSAAAMGIEATAGRQSVESSGAGRSERPEKVRFVQTAHPRRSAKKRARHLAE